MAAGLQFLSLNGWRADLDPPAAAAVVVEALARGQVTPIAAAAWLSPRLAADRRLTAGAPFGRLPFPRNEQYGPEPGGHWKPPAIIFAQRLLYVQAGCWAMGMLGGLILYATGAELIAAPLAAGWLAVAGGMAAAKVALGRRLGRGPTNRTRWAVIATELAMAGFGLLWLTIPAYGVMMLGLSGAALSLAAVLCMIGPRARRFFAGSGGERSTPEPDARSGPASFWPLALAGGVRSGEWSLAG